MEFAAPVGYKEPEKRRPPEEDQMEVDPSQFINKDEIFYTFKGEGSRLDGKKIKEPIQNGPPAHIINSYVRGVPDYDHNIFELKFDRSTRPKPSSKDEKDEDQFKKFQGEGNCLRSKKQ